MIDAKILLERIDAIYLKMQNPEFPGDLVEIKIKRDKLYRMILLSDLRGHEGLNELLKEFTEEIGNINDRLLNENSNKLTDKERDRLIDKRELYADFILYLSYQEKDLEDIEKWISDQENHIKDSSGKWY
jgi:hypothetical protein